jgi:sugar O-acyltransferase (sialic acid O-acetyltransferase NeuD family)
LLLREEGFFWDRLDNPWQNDTACIFVTGRSVVNRKGTRKWNNELIISIFLKDIAIIGAGDFGREIALLVKQINKVRPTWNLMGFYDDKFIKGSLIYKLPVLGRVSELNELTTPINLALGIANPQVKKTIIEELLNPLLLFPTLVYPGCELGDDANVFGKGCLVCCGCIFTVNIRVGEFVIFNLGCTIGHDAKIDSYTSIMPNCNVSGGAVIGSGCYFGTGSIVLQNLSIGDNSVVGAGAVVTRSAAANSKLIGVPARNQNEIS